MFAPIMLAISSTIGKQKYQTLHRKEWFSKIVIKYAKKAAKHEYRQQIIAKKLQYYIFADYSRKISLIEQ